jgi:hypothetical protein
MKICTKCQAEKPKNEFNNWKHGKDEKFHRCKKCCSDANKLYRQKNRDVLLEYNRRYSKNHYEQNKEIVDAKNKRNYEQNKEKWKATRKKYYEENKERLLRLQKERLKDPAKRKRHNEVSAKRDRERCKIDPNYKVKKRLRTRIWNALCGLYKTNKTESLLGTSIDELKTHLESKFVAGMTWENYGDWHIDHIVPCDSFDLSIEENQKKCFHYTNLQPLWAVDNIRKGNRITPPTPRSVLVHSQ